MLTRQPWYKRFDPHPEGTNCFDRTQANSAVCSQSYENTTIFLVSLGQFLIAAFVFNKGPPFRRPIYTNLWLLLGELASGRGSGRGCGGLGGPSALRSSCVTASACIAYFGHQVGPPGRLIPNAPVPPVQP